MADRSAEYGRPRCVLEPGEAADIGGVNKAAHETHLLVIETHPIQYHVPVYRHLEQILGVPVTVVYGSDFSIAGYHDREFGAEVAWDTDLLSGYNAIFLARSSEGGARNDREVNTSG